MGRTYIQQTEGNYRLESGGCLNRVMRHHPVYLYGRGYKDISFCSYVGANRVTLSSVIKFKRFFFFSQEKLIMGFRKHIFRIIPFLPKIYVWRVLKARQKASNVTSKNQFYNISWLCPRKRSFSNSIFVFNIYIWIFQQMLIAQKFLLLINFSRNSVISLSNKNFFMLLLNTWMLLDSMISSGRARELNNRSYIRRRLSSHYVQMQFSQGINYYRYAGSWIDTPYIRDTCVKPCSFV